MIHARFTDRTVASAERLREMLAAEVARRGYAYTVGELETGLKAVAALAYGHDGAVIAGIGVSGPGHRRSEARLPEPAGRFMAAAAELSRRTGYAGSARRAPHLATWSLTSRAVTRRSCLAVTAWPPEDVPSRGRCLG